MAIFVAYYNFCWRTRYPDDSGQSGRKRPTAAMMAGLTDHLWSFEEFFNTIIMYGYRPGIKKVGQVIRP